jgi:hypothetical protein
MARTSASAKSAQVLDEAQRMEDILNWQLFTMEQDTKLWGYNPDVEWTPGEPIYKHPRERMFEFHGHEHNEYNGTWGGWVRPMIQELDDLENFPDEFYERHGCNECQVLGDEADNFCWCCGMSYRERPKPRREAWEMLPTITPNEMRIEHGFDIDRNQIVYRAEADASWFVQRMREERDLVRDMIQRPEIREDRDALEHWVMRGLQLEVGPDWIRTMNEQMRRTQEATRRMAEQVREAQMTMWRNFTDHMHFTVDMLRPFTPEPYRFIPKPSVPYHPPTSGYISNPNRGWWEKPNVVGPLWGIAALFDPREESPLVSARDWNRIQRTIPSNWRELRVDNPWMNLELPELPPVSIPEPAWVQLNQRRMDRDLPAAVHTRRRTRRRRGVERDGQGVHRSRARRP